MEEFINNFQNAYDVVIRSCWLPLTCLCVLLWVKMFTEKD